MSVSEVDKCYLCDLLGDFEQFQDIKKEFDAQHVCWNKSKYDNDNKQNSKGEVKNHEKDHHALNSKSDLQDKPILKIIDLNIENNSKRAEFTAKKINDAIAKIERKTNYQEQIEGWKIKVGLQNLKITSQEIIQEEKKQDKNSETKANCLNMIRKNQNEQENHVLKEKYHKHKKYKCEYCGKKFTSLGGRKYHIQIICSMKLVGQRNYKCNSCEKIFASEVCRKYHIKTFHEGQKNYKCDSCEKKFGKQGQLTEHKKFVHKGIKDFKCDQCSKSFSTKINLRRHRITVHEGRKDFKCDQCDGAFGTKANLKTHKKKYHQK